jgi:hypothetical protein
MAAIVSVVEHGVPVPDNYSSEYLRVAAGTTYLGSAAKAQHELGFAARPLEQGLREMFGNELEATSRR